MKSCKRQKATKSAGGNKEKLLARSNENSLGETDGRWQRGERPSQRECAFNLYVKPTQLPNRAPLWPTQGAINNSHVPKATDGDHRRRKLGVGVRAHPQRRLECKRSRCCTFSV